jgi:hypothetical protein
MSSLTPSRLLTLILFVALFVMPAQPITDPDLWWHIRTGQWMLEQRAIPHTDPFSLTENGKPWVEHEWLANIGLYVLYQIGGLQLLILITCALITLTFALVYRMSALRPQVAVFTTLLAALASAFTWDPRPHILTLFCAALTFCILQHARNGSPRILWWLVPIMFVWVNLHSGFFLGFVFMLTALVGACAEALWVRFTPLWSSVQLSLANIKVALVERDWFPQRFSQTVLLVWIASFAVTLVNPNGLAMHLIPFRTLGNTTIPLYIAEWRSPNFHDPRLLPFAALWLGVLASVAMARRRLHFTDLLLLLGLGYESFVSARNIPFFAIVAAPLITQQLASVFETTAQSSVVTHRPSRLRLMFNWLVALLVLLAAFSQLVNTLLHTNQSVAKIFPAQSAAYLLRTRPAGPLLNSYNFGGYLIWQLYPDYLIFIDGRAEFLYSDAFIREYYARIWQATGNWQAYLDHYHINLVVIETNGALAAKLRHSQRWRVLQSDAVATIFQRVP